jgi:hypothetical protein
LLLEQPQLLVLDTINIAEEREGAQRLAGGLLIVSHDPTS